MPKVKTTVKEDEKQRMVINENVPAPVPSSSQLPTSSRTMGGTRFLEFAPSGQPDFTPEKKAQMEQEQIDMQTQNVAQPSQQAPQEPQTALEKVATFGLKPAEVGANLIMKGLSALQGKEWEWQQTGTQLAETPFGKAVGTATVVGEAILAKALIAKFLPSITGAAEVTVPNIIKANVIKNGLLSKALHSTGLKLIVGGSIVALPTKMQNDSKNAIISSVQSADLIIESVKAGLMSPADAFYQLSLIDKQVSSIEGTMRTWSRLNILNFLGGGKDALVDIENAKANLLLKQAELMSVMRTV